MQTLPQLNAFHFCSMSYYLWSLIIHLDSYWYYLQLIFLRHSLIYFGIIIANDQLKRIATVNDDGNFIYFLWDYWLMKLYCLRFDFVIYYLLLSIFPILEFFYALMGQLDLFRAIQWIYLHMVSKFNMKDAFNPLNIHKYSFFKQALTICHLEGRMILNIFIYFE